METPETRSGIIETPHFQSRITLPEGMKDHERRMIEQQDVQVQQLEWMIRHLTAGATRMDKMQADLTVMQAGLVNDRVAFSVEKERIDEICKFKDAICSKWSVIAALFTVFIAPALVLILSLYIRDKFTNKRHVESDRPLSSHEARP